MPENKQNQIAGPTIFLVDNGSLRADSTRNLRRVATALSGETGRPVWPVSLLHSHKVPARDLAGVPAETFEPALIARAEKGETAFLVVPFFFGPSRALLEYIPERAARLKKRFPELRVRVAPPLVDLDRGGDFRVAGILRDGVIARIEPGRHPAVALVDHGSPVPEVTAVRNFVAGQLSVLLGDRVDRVVPSSMERREADAYRFNEPLLENLLGRPGFDAGPVIVAMMFLSPGKHAGPDGDVARICRRAEAEHPGLRTAMTSLAGEDGGIVGILADRLCEGLSEPAP